MSPRSFLLLATRNLLRQWRRNGLSMVSIIAGVFTLILGRGFISGMNENIIRAQIDSMSGHVLVRPADYPNFGIQHPVDALATTNPAVDAWLEQNAAAWTKRVLFVPRMIKGSDAMRVRAFGYDPATDGNVFSRQDWRIDGRLPESASDGLLVSTGVARLLALQVGDQVVLEQRTAAGALNALGVPVGGIVRTNNPVIDQIGVFVPGPLVADLVRPGDGFSHLAIRLDDRDDATAAASALAGLLGQDAEVTTWVEETADMMELQAIRQKMLDMLVFALMAIAATGIANTVLMAAYERIREIGTLRALGLTRGGVVGLFMTEGLLMGVLGSIFGGALGGGYVHHLSVKGIDMSGFIEQASEQGGYENLPFSLMLYTDFSEPTIAAAMLFGVFIAVAASVYPAQLATRLAPADAVRAS